MSTFMIDLSENTLKSIKAERFTIPKKNIDSYHYNEIKPFEVLLSDSIRSVNDIQMESDKLVQRLATGDVDDISEVILASSRAEVALRMLMEVRNKLLEAYQQISRIQS